MKSDEELLRATATILRRLREQAGKSQEELAAESGLSRSMIDRCERRERLPSLAILIKLSKPLNIKASEIIRLIENEMHR